MTNRIVVVEFLTLDGFMAGPGGDQSPFADSWSTDLDRETLDQQRGVGAILLGRRAYEQMSAYWPTAADENESVYQHMNMAAKFVVSGSLSHAPWGGFAPAEVLPTLEQPDVQALRERSDGDIAVIGSAAVVQQLQRLNEIDEYKIMLFPTLLGDGVRLFATDRQPQPLTLTHSHELSDGVTVLHLSTGGG